MSEPSVRSSRRREREKKEKDLKLLQQEQEAKNKHQPSKAWFFATQLGVFGIAALGGVYGIMRKHDPKHASLKSGTIKGPGGGAVRPMAFAARAFLYGTVLCVGSFATAGALLVATTGISTVDQFVEKARAFTKTYVLDLSTSVYTEEQKKEDLEVETELNNLLSAFYNEQKAEDEKGQPKKKKYDKKSSDGELGTVASSGNGDVDQNLGVGGLLQKYMGKIGNAKGVDPVEEAKSKNMKVFKLSNYIKELFDGDPEKSSKQQPQQQQEQQGQTGSVESQSVALNNRTGSSDSSGSCK